MLSKKKNAFTLIELIIVVAILAVLAAITVHKILQLRRQTREKIVISTLRGFVTGAEIYSNTTPSQYFWESETTDFGEYFPHKSPKRGYFYKYYSDDTVLDGCHEAVCYIYLGYPNSTTSGTRAFFTDEAHRIWQSNKLDNSQIEQFKNLDPNTHIKWDRKPHVDISDISWTEK